MVKSHFSFVSYTDIVQVFQSMFSDNMIAKTNGPWRTEASLWNSSIFDEINQKKDKKKKIYMFSYLMNL